MGTNYYIQIDKCNKYVGAEDEYHIGKSSAGWCFALHVDPTNGISTLNDITKLWSGKKIKNEYGDNISEDEMYSIIMDRRWEKNRAKKVLPCGYKTWKEFHDLNYSERGPNGLLRHQIDGCRCIGHGNGTYDYVIGEFC